MYAGCCTVLSIQWWIKLGSYILEDCSQVGGKKNRRSLKNCGKDHDLVIYKLLWEHSIGIPEAGAGSGMAP